MEEEQLYIYLIERQIFISTDRLPKFFTKRYGNSKVRLPKRVPHLYLELRTGPRNDESEQTAPQDDKSGRILREIHFSAQGHDAISVITRPLNYLAAVADVTPQPLSKIFSSSAGRAKKGAGLAVDLDDGHALRAFARAVDKAGIGEHLLRLTGEQYDHNFVDPESIVAAHLCFQGPRKEVLDMWNEALERTLAINLTNIPFFYAGLPGRDGNNCRTGLGEILRHLGLDDATAPMMQRHGFGRQVPGLSNVPVDGGGPDDSSLRGRWAYNKKLHRALSLTS